MPAADPQSATDGFYEQDMNNNVPTMKRGCNTISLS